MTTEQKKRAINRLQSMRPLRTNIDKTYTRVVEASKAGKPTAWCMVNWWEADPILCAMGVEAIYPENYGAVCAADGIAQVHLERSDVEGFPSYLCGYARNSLGYAAIMKELGEVPPGAPLGGMDKPMLIVGSGALCDARYKWVEALGRYLDAPLWTVELPHPGVKERQQDGAYEEDIRFMVNGLREFVTFLENLLNKKMDWDKLDETANDFIALNRVWYEVNELRKARPGPMHSRDFWTCMTASLYPGGDLKESVQLYQDMLVEMKDRVGKKIGAVEPEKYRLVFAELPPWHDLKVFDELAERGWNFVIESWAYHPPKPIDLSNVSDPVERIARQTYQWFTGYYQDAWESREYMGYFAYPYLEFARDYQVDGAFLHPLISCRTATNHLMMVQDRLLGKLKIPSMVVEGDIVDLNAFDHDGALRKAEAFEEIMDNYKQLRKEAGMAW